MKRIIRDSPIENSVNNYNQIYMISIVWSGYIAKSFISGNDMIVVKC